MDNRPIGVFDSGIGGLTVVEELRKILPNEDIIYFGDTARVPYGTKSKETVKRFAIEDVLFLLSFDVKAVVVACNTASSLALECLKAYFALPFIGVVEPGAVDAARKTKKGKVGVIGTASTVRSGAYTKAIMSIDENINVYSKACPLFVPLVEEGILDGPIVDEACRLYLSDFKKQDIDVIILGCTHYPLLKGSIQRFLGEKVEVVSSSVSAAVAAASVLKESGKASNKESEGGLKIFVSDDSEGVKKALDKVFRLNLGTYSIERGNYVLY